MRESDTRIDHKWIREGHDCRKAVGEGHDFSRAAQLLRNRALASEVSLVATRRGFMRSRGFQKQADAI